MDKKVKWMGDWFREGVRLVKEDRGEKWSKWMRLERD